LTFSNRDVVKALGIYKVIQIDVTRNTAEDQALLKRFSLFGPPAILFIDKNGVELTDKRVIGFMKAERFLDRIN
jgi:thiol:disulfide interchange protein DsbD